MAHELGHNFGMVDGSGGIMSYNTDSAPEWSTASKSEFERHYVSQNWGDGCLEAGKIFYSTFANSNRAMLRFLYKFK